MVDAKLVQYVKKYRGQYSDSTLRTALKKQGYSAQDIKDALSQTNRSAPPPVGGSSTKSVDDDKLFAILGYLGILVVIPIVMKRDNPFVMFHAKQGLVLTILGMVIGFGSFIIGIFISFIPWIGWLLSLFLSLFSFVLYLGIFILFIVGIVYAAKGEQWRMPIIGYFADKVPL